MNRILPNVAGALLGLAFLAAGGLVLLDLAPEMPPPPEGSPAAHFMAAFWPTGYLKYVKVLEVGGGVLVAVPRTRVLGLLVLGPILVNILAYHVFVMGGEGLFEPMIVAIVALTGFLAWAERRAFVGLLRSAAQRVAGT